MHYFNGILDLYYFGAFSLHKKQKCNEEQLEVFISVCELLLVNLFKKKCRLEIHKKVAHTVSSGRYVIYRWPVKLADFKLHQ